MARRIRATREWLRRLAMALRSHCGGAFNRVKVNAETALNWFAEDAADAAIFIDGGDDACPIQWINRRSAYEASPPGIGCGVCAGRLAERDGAVRAWGRQRLRR